MADNFWEKMSGTSKQSYGASLYDAKEMKKWEKEQQKWYDDLGKTRDRYGTQSTKFMGKYEDAEKEADRYRGLAETEFGRSRAEIDRARGAFGRAEGDIERARSSQMSANALMADRDHYSNLKRRAEERRRGVRGDRLEMQSLRGRLGKPSQDTGMTQRLLDAFKGSNESNREIMEANTAQLAKTNPAAAARMQAQFNEGTLRSVGQLKQQGRVTDQQLSDNNLSREAGMLMDSTALYGQEAAQDQQMAGYQQQQIQNYGAAGTQALNVAGAMGNVGRNYLSGAGAYAGLGGQYGQMGSQLDARAGRALGVGMQYEGMGYNALQDQTSIANRRVERQDKFRMSDAAARARVDSFNRSRGQQGFSNVMKVVETGARIYAAGATGGASELAVQALKAKQAKDQRAAAEQQNKTNTSQTYVNMDEDRHRTAFYKNLGKDTSVQSPDPYVSPGNPHARNIPSYDPIVQPSVQPAVYGSPGMYGPPGGYMNSSLYQPNSPPRIFSGSGSDQNDMSNRFTGTIDDDPYGFKKQYQYGDRTSGYRGF